MAQEQQAALVVFAAARPRIADRCAERDAAPQEAMGLGVALAVGAVPRVLVARVGLAGVGGEGDERAVRVVAELEAQVEVVAVGQGRRGDAGIGLGRGRGRQEGPRLQGQPLL